MAARPCSCYSLLGSAIVYGYLGIKNQMKMIKVQLAMDDPEVTFEPKGRYDKALVWMNEWLGVVFVFNDLVKQSGEQVRSPFLILPTREISSACPAVNDMHRLWD